MSDFIESILQSVDIIIDKRLEDVAYDSTIICTIIDDSDKKNGKYRVSDGSVTYVAYSDQNNYKKGDQIRMSVPMGDFSQKKFIIGKYVTDSNTEPITYVSPADTVLNISGNFANGITGSILANGSVTEKELWGAALDEKIISLQSNNLYNTIVLSCNFKTDLANYQMINGNYGLNLDFVTRPSLKSEHVIINRITLDSSEMFGNPYLFAINSPQAKVIKLDTFGIVEGMSLKLYQKGNFRDNKENLIPTYDGQPDNIFVNNIAIGMGCDLTLLEDNKLQLYTDDGVTYKYNTHTDETNLKTMGILWLNKDDENRYVGFSDGIYDPTYDELEYLEKSKVNARLVKYKGKEGVPLDEESLNLAANIDEAATAITKAVNVVNRDLVRVLREFQSMMTNITEISNNIGLLLNADNNPGSKYLGNFTSSVTSNLSTLQKIYKNVLQYGWEKINPPEKDALVWNSEWDTNYHKLIEDTFTSIQEQINWLLSTEENYKEDESGGCVGVTAEGKYSGYKSIYDSFKIRIDKIIAMMWGYLNKAPDNYSYLNTSFPKSFFKNDKEIYLDYETLKKYQEEKTEFPPYKEPDLSSYDNKYCIYWYRYEKGYKAPASEQLLPEEWRRLTVHDAYEQVENLTEEQFGQGIHYILEDGKYTKADKWTQNEIYYRCISEADKDKINIGLSSIYYYTEGLDKKWKYERTTKYREDLLYYDDKFNLVEKKDLTETDVVAGKYYVKVCMNDDGKPIHDLKPSPGNGTLTQYMQYDLNEEKYMVVLFHNHTMYKSNELVFTNEDVIPDKTTLDKGDILIFEHLENSADNYQSYNITNYLMDERDKTLNRQLRCHYDGLLAKDNAFIGGQIYWYVPNQSTMITVDEAWLKKSGFIIDETRSNFEYQPIDLIAPFSEPPVDEDFYSEGGKHTSIKTSFTPYVAGKYYIKNEEGILPQYILSDKEYVAGTHYFERILIETCYYKTISGYKKENAEQEKYEWDKWEYKNKNSNIDNRDFWYQIKPYYQDSAQNNYIKCEFIKSEDNDSVFGQQLFTFGVAGTSGTKYTLAVTKGEGQTSTTDVKTLPLKAQLKDFNNNVLDFTIATKESFTTTWDFIPGDVLDKGSIYHISRNNTEGWFEAGAGSYGIIRTTARVNLTGKTIPGAPTDGSSDAEHKGATRQIDLVTLHAVPWAMGDYYIDGTTQIIYNSYGTLDNNSMYNTSYKLFTKNNIVEKDGNVIIEAGHTISNVEWSINLYIKDRNNKFILLEKKNPQYNNYAKYMPKLFDNTLIPAPLYLDGLDCYVVVECKEKSGQVLWKQPIIIMQNRYPSPMLNSWDGTFEINEENGTIMSTMIGAGRKEAGDNTFSGVLMGDVYDGGSSSFNPENKTGLGIYGFHHGAQSFGFNVDGTAFLGKAGNGRILFNGDYGIIASANWFTGVNNEDHENYDPITNPHPNGGKINSDGSITQSNAGMCINLEDGHIDAYNFKLTSNGIFLNSNPEEDGDNYFYIGNSEHYIYFKKGGQLKVRALNNKKGDIPLHGVVISTNPANGDHYFRVTAQSGDGIRFWKDDDGAEHFRIDAHNFTLSTSNIYLSDTPKKFTIGKNEDSNIVLRYGDNFGVTADGKIYASSGKVGGWNIASTFIDSYTGTRSKYQTRFKLASDADDENYYIFARGSIKNAKGEITGYETKFSVSKDGVLFAKGADIAGKITATSGTIGKCTIDENGYLVVPAARITGQLSADHIDVSSITIDMAQVTGTLSAERVSFGSKTKAEFTDDGNFRIYGGERAQYLYISPSSIYLSGTRDGYGSTFMLGYCPNGYHIYTSCHNGYLGGTWSSTSEIAVISDRNQKNSIETLDMRYENFFNNLQPIRFKYNNGTSDRYHTGFIAQDIYTALNTANLFTEEFSGYVERHLPDGTQEYFLRYENFISLNTWQIQKLKSKISTLENKISELESKLL